MRIAAIFATMNRAATAVACVRALAAQTRPPEMVVVADNASADETVARLEELEDLPFELVIHRMPENLGNAGGVRDAMELAFERGVDAVWILDDDSWPRPGALAGLLSTPWDSQSVRHALQIDPKTGRFTWPLLLPEQKRAGRLTWCEDELPAGELVESLASWTGALVPRAVRNAVGPVMAELFIRGEDEEYPQRVARAGYRFYACRSALMDHPGPADLVLWRIAGKCLFYERGLEDWKLYYKVRNMVWIRRNQSGSARAMMLAAAYALAAARIDGIHRLPLIWEAVADGWKGRLGKRGEKDRPD